VADNTAGNVRPQGWTQAFAEKSEASFADNFAAGVTLEASVLARPVEGLDRVKTVMAAASRIYEELKFTQETTFGRRTYLEWEAKAFGGHTLLGVTVITKDTKGLIARIDIHHRPPDVALRFSTELRKQLEGAIESDYFYDGKPDNQERKND
jgi:hypothetical protein